LFNPDQLALTGVLAEMIIPATDTPGALAAGAHQAIGRLLLDCESAANQRRFVAGLAMLDKVAGAEGGAGFAALPAARRGELMALMEAGGAPFTNTDKRFFIQLKALTVFAYCTSEAGATLALSYLPVPGGYQGNVPLARVGRAWAL
ncbi:MAG TPA: gluconate 2-dehydrogenase subunit 3 family protein, partial [Duganella sp.]|uniref:gluconate 2-dehydrogenase subunit 3 family protein n=1 Tax=Duganella sp. TaxID=1904440 RepID=UPI002ED59593